MRNFYAEFFIVKLSLFKNFIYNDSYKALKIAEVKKKCKLLKIHFLWITSVMFSASKRSKNSLKLGLNRITTFLHQLFFLFISFYLSFIFRDLLSPQMFWGLKLFLTMAIFLWLFNGLKNSNANIKAYENLFVHDFPFFLVGNTK